MTGLRSAVAAVRDRWQASSQEGTVYMPDKANARVMVGLCAEDLTELLRQHPPRLVRINARDLEAGDIYCCVARDGDDTLPFTEAGRMLASVLEVGDGESMALAFVNSVPDEKPPRTETVSGIVWAVIG